MAAAYVTKGTTVETQLLELLEKIADLQATASSNPDNVTVIPTYTRNMVTGVLTATISLPVSSAPDSVSGLPVLSAEEVFS